MAKEVSSELRSSREAERQMDRRTATWLSGGLAWLGNTGSRTERMSCSEGHLVSVELWAEASVTAARMACTCCARAGGTEASVEEIASSAPQRRLTLKEMGLHV